MRPVEVEPPVGHLSIIGARYRFRGPARTDGLGTSLVRACTTLRRNGCFGVADGLRASIASLDEFEEAPVEPVG